MGRVRTELGSPDTGCTPDPPRFLQEFAATSGIGIRSIVTDEELSLIEIQMLETCESVPIRRVVHALVWRMMTKLETLTCPVVLRHHPVSRYFILAHCFHLAFGIVSYMHRSLSHTESECLRNPSKNNRPTTGVSASPICQIVVNGSLLKGSRLSNMRPQHAHMLYICF